MTTTLSQVDSQVFAQAERMVIDMLRAEYPSMDLRAGTVLRELVVRPDSAFYALEDGRYRKLEAVRSLAAIAENPDGATDADIDHILSNFRLTRQSGSRARGSARVHVARDQAYAIPRSFELVAGDGLVFRPDGDYLFTSAPREGSTQRPLFAEPAGGGWYFVLPVVAAEVGVDYMLAPGTALRAEPAFDGFIAAEAFSPFAGGTERETVARLMQRLPAAISHRSLESRASIESALRSPENGGFGDVLEAVSVQGYGDAAQLRDKHNPTGVATGGKVDIYARTFVAPALVMLEKQGALIAPNTYRIVIDAGDAPGFYDVFAVADPESVINPEFAFGEIRVLGSYAVTDTREAQGISNTFHAIEPEQSMVETAYTVFQRATLVVHAVGGEQLDVRPFKVMLYGAPRLDEIQKYVDDPRVRNLKADYLVRCPLICLVRVNARVVVRPGARPNPVEMHSDLLAYINSRSFVSKLTASELFGVLHRHDILRVEPGPGSGHNGLLSGVVRDGLGRRHQLTGPVLDLGAAADARALMTPQTCVFAANPFDVFLNVVQEVP